MVYDLIDNTWSKSHRGALGKQKAFPSVLQEPNKPELSHDLDGLHHCSLSQPESIRKGSASARHG